MAEIHNIRDLKAICLLENELLDVRNELRQWGGYDPTLSLAENAKIMLGCGKLLGQLHQKLKIQYNELKKEQENDKITARSYPLSSGGVDNVGDCALGGVSTYLPPPIVKTVADYYDSNPSNHGPADFPEIGPFFRTEDYCR